MDAIERILRHPPIANRPRLIKLLQYIVREEIEDRGERLKGFTIAMDVFERDDDFDPQTDSIVRVEMFRLRQGLAEYYVMIGEDDPLRIEVPKGTYRPTFTVQKEAEPTPVVAPPTSKVLSLRADLAACVAVALVGAGYLAAAVGERAQTPFEISKGGPCAGVIPTHFENALLSFTAPERSESDDSQTI